MRFDNSDRKLSILTVLAFTVLVLSLIACDIGLGNMVNTEKPVISMPGGYDKKPGDFLNGCSNLIYLDVQQPFGLKEVYMIIKYECDVLNLNRCTNSAHDHPHVSCSECIRLEGACAEVKEIRIEAKYDSKSGKYWVNIDTTFMHDGTIRTQVTAVDSSDRVTTTTEIIYNVKNTPAQIELTIPKVKGNEFDAEDLNEKLKAPDQVIITGNSIMGIATDAFGIAAGYPQIKLWPAPGNIFYPDVQYDNHGMPLYGDKKWGEWRTVLDSQENPLSQNMLKAVQFRWPLYEYREDGNFLDVLPAGNYRFMIRTKDGFNIENTYPDRHDKKRDPAVTYPQFMEITLIASNNPIIVIRQSHPEAKWLTGTTVHDPDLSYGVEGVDFPSLYNGDGDFGESVIAKMTIKTGNPPLTVYAKISNPDDDGIDEMKDDIRLISGNVIETNNAFYIRISKDKIKEMLGSTISGDKTLHIKAVDVNGNESTYSKPIVIDNVPPEIEIIDPQGLLNTDEPPTVTSTVVIRGAATDNQQVSEMYYALGLREVNKIDLGNEWNNHTGWNGTGLGSTPYDPHTFGRWGGTLSSWTWTFDDISAFVKSHDKDNYISEYTDPEDPSKTNLWKLPIKFKVIDKAKNVSIIDAALIIDPDADIPTVEINSHRREDELPIEDYPGIKGTIVGGTVRINGTATDNDWIHSVQIKVTMQTEAMIKGKHPFSAQYPGEVMTKDEAGVKGFQTININNPSSTVSWFYNLNTDQSLTYNGGRRLVKVEVRARDASISNRTVYKQEGLINTIYFSFDPGVPDIKELKIIRGKYSDYYSPTTEVLEEEYQPGVSFLSGFITLKAVIQDDHDLTSIKLQNWNWTGQTWSENYLKVTTSNDTTPFVIKDGINNDGKAQYTMYIPLNTTARNGNYDLGIEILDDTTPVPYRLQNTISLMLDNTLPSIEFIMPSGFGNTVDPPVLTSTVEIRGAATDNQQVSEVYYALGKTETYNPNLDLNWNFHNGWTNTGLGVSPKKNHPPDTHIRSEWSGSLASWSWRFENIADMCTTAVSQNYYVEDAGYGLWELPIKFKIIDKARNVRIIDAVILLDPFADTPRVEITSHTTDREIVGGAVRISGTAADNDRIDSVEIRVTMQSDTDAKAGRSFADSSNIIPMTHSGNDNFVPVYYMGNKNPTVSWYHNVNTEGELTLTGGKREVLIEVRAIDAYGFSPFAPKNHGNIEKRILSFDSGIPTIEIEKIIHGRYDEYHNSSESGKRAMEADYTPGMTWVSDFVTLMVKIQDDHDVTSIRLRNWQSQNQLGATNYINSRHPNSSTPFVEDNGIQNSRKEYIMYIPLDTNDTLLGGIYKDKSNTYSLDIEVLDDTSPVSYSATSTVSIVIDNIKPSMDFIQPSGFGTASPPLVTSTVIIRGSALDNQQVASLYYALGKSETSNPNLGKTRDNHNGWSAVHFGACDCVSPDLCVKPEHNHPNPGDAGWFNIQSKWTGQLSSWSWRFEDAAQLAAGVNASSGNYYLLPQDTSKNIWLLPVKFKIIDKAGNVQIVDAAMIVEPDADKPTVQINSHTTDGEIVGGTVRINGIASDNEWIHSVEIRITKKDTNEVITANLPKCPLSSCAVCAQSDDNGFINVTRPVYYSESAAADKHEIRGATGNPSSTVSWYYNLNTNDELTSDGNREVLIEVRAKDASIYSHNIPKRSGDPASRLLSFDSGIPSIEIEKIIYGNYNQYNSATPEKKLEMEGDYIPGMTWVSGFVTLKAVIQDDHKVTSVRLRNWHAATLWSPTNFINSINSGVSQPFVVHNGIVNGKDKYTLYIPLDTNGTFLNGAYKDKSNTYSLDIEVLDNTSPVPYKTQSTVSLVIDNIKPSMSFIQPSGISTSPGPKVTSALTIRGSALDNQAIDKVFYALGVRETRNAALGSEWNNHTGWTDTRLGVECTCNDPNNCIDPLHKPRTNHPNPGITGAPAFYNVPSVWSGQLSSWSWQFNDIKDLCEEVSASGNYFVEMYGNAIDNLWSLPVKFKIVDKARNVTIVNASMLLEPDADLPTIKITSHEKPEDRIVGGSVRITGTAADNEWVHSIWIKITKAPDGAALILDDDGNAMNGTVITAGMAGAQGGYIPVESHTSLGSNVSWSHEINKENELIYANGKREVLIEVRAGDASVSNTASLKQYGRQAKLLLTFDAGVPTIDIEKVIKGTYSEWNAASDDEKKKMEGDYSPNELISGTVTLLARIKDDNVITSIRLQNWNNFGTSSSAWSSDYRNVTTPSIATPFVKKKSDGEYELFIPVITGTRNGSFKMDIEAQDNTSPVASRTQVPLSFMMDNTKPQIQFIQPTGLGVYSTYNETTGQFVVNANTQLLTLASTVIIRGSVHDNQQLESFHYALGVTETKNTALGVAYDNHTGWTETGLAASSETGNPAQVHIPKTGSGTINAQWSGMFPAWTWRFNDIADVCLGSSGSTGNYYVEAYDATKNLWMLPIKLKLVDKAKNVQIIEVRIVVDPDLDRPRVEITHPDEEKKVGGIVRINGEARDNDWINTVEIRVKYLDGAVWKPASGYYNPSIANPTESDAIFRKVNYNFGTETIPDIRGNRSEGATVTWQHTINSKGDLTPVGTVERKVRIEVRAGDAYTSTPEDLKQYGNIETLNLTFDSGVPVINIYVFGGKKDLPNNTSSGGITNNLLPAPNDPTLSPRVKEELSLWVKITDDSDIASVRLRNWDGSGNWGSVNYAAAGNIRTSPPGAGNTTPYIIKAPNEGAGDNLKTVYWMYIPLDTNKTGSNNYDQAYLYNMDIEVIDASQIQYTTQQTISLEIDNFHPLATFNSGLTAVARDTATKPYDFQISGDAWDTAQTWTRLGGVERIVVYFSTVPASGAFGTPVSLGGETATTGDTTHWIWAANSDAQIARRDRIGTVPNSQEQSKLESTGTAREKLPFFPRLVPFVPGSPYYGSTDYAIVIDKMEQSRANTISTSNGPRTLSYTTSFSDAAVRAWSINLDARCLPDGQYMLHFVVFDTAENATHYSRKITIAINRPILRDIILGTDVDGDGTITGTETVTKTVSASGNTDIVTDFRIRNSRFSVNLGSAGGLTGGNLPNHYRLSYVTRNAATTKTLVKGQVYTIAVDGKEEWLNYGVFDNTSLYDGITFVAIDNATLTNGSVYSYTTPSQGTPVINGDTITLTNFTGITDSAKDGNGNVTAPNDKTFIIKVWDSISPNEAGALAHAAVLKLSIDNTDSRNPEIHVAELGKKYNNPADTKYSNRTETASYVPANEYNQNIVTTESEEKKGYLQYKDHNVTRADVSGMVIFKGKAHDNVRIQYITALIPGYTPATGAGIPTVDGLNTNEFVIAQWDSSANRILPARSGYTIEAMRDDSNTNHWGFDAPDSEHKITMDDAHVLNWNFAFDSSMISTVAASNVTITFRVRDYSGRWSTTSATTNVNIVPYITEIVTPLSDAMSSNKSAFNRSANGWYPVRENDTIEVKGFNFNDTSTHILVGGTRFTPTVVGSNTRTHLSFNIGTAAVSGALKVNVGGTAGTGNNANVVTGGIDSINNSNNEEARYNMEPNGLNNNILTDNRYIYVWRTGYLLNNAVIQSPYMRVHSNSRWFLTYGTQTGGTGYLNVIRDTGSAVENQQIQTDTNRYLNMRMALDSAGDWFIGASNQTATANQTYAMHARGPTYSSDTNTTNANNVSNGSNHRRLIALNGISSKVRFPSVATLNTNSGATGNAAAATKVITSYYDATGNDNAVIMHYGLIGGGSTLGIASGFGGDFPTNGAGGNRAYNTQRSFFARAQIVANNNTGHQGSMYTAAGVLSNGLPVVAWYDRTNQRLVFSYGSGATTSNALNDSYFVKAVNGNNFSLNADNTNTIANNNGQNISGGQNITIMRPIRPTAVNANNGTTYTFAAGVSFEDNEQVTIYFTNSDGTTTRYDNHYARVINAANRTYSFAEQYGSGTYINFQNAANHHLRLSIYSARQGVTTTAVVTGINYQYTLANHGLSASTYPFSFTNIATVTAGGTTGNASQADINTALNTIVNHVNNTFGVSVAAAAMNATVNAANVGTAINAVINNIRSALGITIATVADPTGVTRANVNTRLATAVANINNAIGYINLTYTNLTSTAGNNTTTNVSTGTASTTAVTQVLVNAALNTIVNHVNNTFGVSVAAAAMSTTINVGNIATAINDVINNINTALGTSIATVTNPASTGRTDVNTRLTTAVNSINTALSALTTTIIPYNNANRVLVRNNIVSTLTGSSGQAGTWQGNAVVLHEFAGTHVDMAVDADNNIHLAYYDVFNGGLYYAHITPIGTGYNMHPNTTNGIKIARVDTYLSAGTKIMLNVRPETHSVVTRYVPYISYLHASFAETRNSVRVAWLRPDENGDISVRHGTYGRSTSAKYFVSGHVANTDYPEDSFTGEWEVMTVPTQTVPLSDEFVCNGVPTSGNFRSNGGLTAYTNMPTTIIMGYMTDTHYEGAILKDNIINKDMKP